MTVPVPQRIFPFAVHLPLLIRRRALKPRRRRTMHRRSDPPVPFQNSMNGAHRQFQSLFVSQNHLELLGTPTRLLAQTDDASLFPLPRLPRTAMRTPALLGQRREGPRLPISAAPQIPRRTRNAELLAQRRHSFLSARRSNHKLHALLAHLRRLPPHGFWPPRPETLLPMCKGCVGNECKGCHGTVHFRAAPLGSSTRPPEG